MPLLPRTVLLLLCLGTLPAPAAEPVPAPGLPSDAGVDLLDQGLSRWEKFLGCPHHSVQGLPTGTPTSTDGKQGTPLGLGQDPKDVFRVIVEDGQPVLQVSGEIFGGLSTRDSFRDYHLSLEYRWGEKRWPPRERARRDSGLLYHAQGSQGVFWNAWMAAVEFQVQEGDVGDLFLLAGPTCLIRSADGVWDVTRPLAPPPGRVRHAASQELPPPQWNRMDLYALGDRAIHVVNGVVVNALDQIRRNGQPLTEGKIQLQSEGATISYRTIRLLPMTSFPADLATAAGFDRP